MKQTSNAIKFLLAQYRSIFKNAYFKGLATAVVVTAGLAAGAAQAANPSNAFWFTGKNVQPDPVNPSTFNKGQSFGQSNSGLIITGGIDSEKKAELDGVVSGGHLVVGKSDQDSHISEASNASGMVVGGYVGIGTNTSGTSTSDYTNMGINAVAANNTLDIFNGTVKGNAIGGWAKNNAGLGGSATASNNTVNVTWITDTETPARNTSTITVGGQIIGGYASGLNNASAEGNTVEITGNSANKASLSLTKNIYGGFAGADSGTNSSNAIYSAAGNTVNITNTTFTGQHAVPQIAGGSVIAWGTTTAQTFTATENSITIKNSDISTGMIAANLVDADAAADTNRASVSNAIVRGSDDTGVIVEGSTVSGASLAGALVTGTNSITAENNRVTLRGTNSLSDSHIFGVTSQLVVSSGSNATANLINNSFNTDEDVDGSNTLTDTSIFGASLQISSGSTPAKPTDLKNVNITANGNSLTAGENTKMSVSKPSGSDYIYFVATQLAFDSNIQSLSGSTVTANNNSVEFNGTFTGTDKNSSSNWLGAVVSDHGNAIMRNNKVTIGGEVSNATIFGAFNGSSENTTNFTPNLSDNSVTVTKDAVISNADIYAGYGENLKTLSTNNDVTISGKLTNTSIYGGMGADSVVNLDSSSRYIVANGSENIYSDVVDIAGTVEVNAGATLNIHGYATNGKLKVADSFNPNSTTFAATSKIYNAGTMNLYGQTEIVDGAALYATGIDGKIVVDGKTVKIDSDYNKTNDIFGAFVNDGETILTISDDLLKSYLDGGVEYTTSNINTPLTSHKGRIEVLSGGGIDFRDSVVLSDFDFTTTNEAGKIKIEAEHQKPAGLL